MAVITISREYGSGGNQIAGLICERLGYRYFDKHLMAQLSAPTDLKAALEAAGAAESQGESPQQGGALGRFFRNLLASSAASTYGGEEAAGGELPLDAVERLIGMAYEEDNVVIVGRAGQMVLSGKPDALHVRLVAPLEKRTQAVKEFEGVTADVALDRVGHLDRAAAGYLKQNYGVNVADPALYDIVINTARLAPEVATDLVIGALAGLAPRKQ